MEIEKDIIRLSPDDVTAFAMYVSDHLDSPDLQDIANALELRIADLEATGLDYDNRIPIITIPYSRRFIDIMEAALHASRDQDAVHDEAEVTEALREKRVQALLQRRAEFLDGTIQRLDSRRNKD